MYYYHPAIVQPYFGEEMHTQLIRLVNFVNSNNNKQWRDLLFLIWHETGDLGMMFEGLNKEEYNFANAKFIRDRVRIFDDYLNNHETSFDFDRTREVNSKGILAYDHLKNMVSEMRGILETSS